MYAGQTLAQLALVASTDPAGVRAELQARIDRQGKSAKNAQKALARMDAGESVAIPAPAPKAPKASAPAPARKVSNPNLAGNVQRAQARVSSPRVTREDAFRLVIAEGRAAGRSIPRWISAGAKGRAVVAQA